MREDALRVRRVEGAPVVAVRAWVKAGARVEPRPGQAILTGRLLSEGTARRDWRRIAEEADARGAIVSSFANFETHGVSIDALADDWELAIDWAAELLFEPTFPDDRAAWLARQAAAELESEADQPEVKTSWGFFEQLYTPHPRCRPLLGTAESLLALTPGECAAFHRRALSNGVLVAVAGAIDEAAVTARLDAVFGSRGAHGAPEPFQEPLPPVGMPEPLRRVTTEAEDQAHLYIGQITIPRRHPDYTALETLSVILGSGAGLTGRIPLRIREQEGLAYSAYAQAVSGSGLDPGRLVAYVGTSPETAEKARLGVIEEITKVVEGGVTDAEVEEARAYLLGREPFRRETARQWVELLEDALQYDLPLDDPAWRNASLEAVDRQAVEEAARRHIDPAKLQVTVGLPK
jgi:zinc protease